MPKKTKLSIGSDDQYRELFHHSIKSHNNANIKRQAIG